MFIKITANIVKPIERKKYYDLYLIHFNNIYMDCIKIKNH